MSEKSFRYNKEVLYDIEWQVLRVSLLKQYNNYGGWSEESGILKNIDKLRAYFTAADMEDEAARRCWRCMNLLAAVMLGYKKENTKFINICKKYHQELAKVYKESEWGAILSRAKGHQWDWDKVRTELADLFLNDFESFAAIEENLLSRKKTADRKNRLGIGGMQYRDELKYFMDMMLEVKENTDL